LKKSPKESIDESLNPVALFRAASIKAAEEQTDEWAIQRAFGTEEVLLCLRLNFHVGSFQVFRSYFI
jgi:hypothetical protein